MAVEALKLLRSGTRELTNAATRPPGLPTFYFLLPPVMVYNFKKVVHRFGYPMP